MNTSMDLSMCNADTLRLADRARAMKGADAARQVIEEGAGPMTCSKHTTPRHLTFYNLSFWDRRGNSTRDAAKFGPGVEPPKKGLGFCEN